MAIIIIFIIIIHIKNILKIIQNEHKYYYKNSYHISKI